MAIGEGHGARSALRGLFHDADSAAEKPAHGQINGGSILQKHEEDVNEECGPVSSFRRQLRNEVAECLDSRLELRLGRLENKFREMMGMPPKALIPVKSSKPQPPPPIEATPPPLPPDCNNRPVLARKPPEGITINGIERDQRTFHATKSAVDLLSNTLYAGRGQDTHEEARLRAEIMLVRKKLVASNVETQVLLRDMTAGRQEFCRQASAGSQAERTITRILTERNKLPETDRDIFESNAKRVDELCTQLRKARQDASHWSSVARRQAAILEREKSHEKEALRNWLDNVSEQWKSNPRACNLTAPISLIKADVVASLCSKLPCGEVFLPPPPPDLRKEAAMWSMGSGPRSNGMAGMRYGSAQYSQYDDDDDDEPTDEDYRLWVARQGGPPAQGRRDTPPMPMPPPGSGGGGAPRPWLGGLRGSEDGVDLGSASESERSPLGGSDQMSDEDGSSRRTSPKGKVVPSLDLGDSMGDRYFLSESAPRSA